MCTATDGAADGVAPLVDYFDALVNLIPARYYLPPTEDTYTNKRWHSTSERARAKQEKAEQMKKFKRSKLDPANARTTVEAQAELAAKDAAERAAASASAAANGGGAPAAANGAGASAAQQQHQQPPPQQNGHHRHHANNTFSFGDATGATDAERPDAAGAARPSHVELQRRLHERLAHLRGKRKADEGRASAQAATQWREQVLAQRKKRKENKKAGRAAAAGATATDTTPTPTAKKKKSSKNKFKPGGSISAPDATAAAAAAALSGGKVRTNTATARVGEKVLKLEFSKVNVDPTGAAALPDDGKKRKKRKQSTQEALEKAVRLQEALQKERSDGGGAALAEGSATRRHAWESALARAGGQKVLDNPSRLRATLKREERSKAKSREAWKKRTEAQAELQAKKQDKRRKNLQKVKDQKIAKKIDKGEKKRIKSQLRAGFEGRGGGKFVN
eukprot:PRCOL_00002513-RA